LILRNNNPEFKHVAAELFERDGIKAVDIIHRRPYEAIIQLEW
jgi:hypothetical protein